MVVVLYFLSLFFALIGIAFTMLYSLLRIKVKNKIVLMIGSVLYMPIFFLFANIPYVIEKSVGYGSILETLGGYLFYYGFILFLWIKNRCKIKKVLSEWHPW